MKQVHWQLPFGSLDGEQYRIDIYAEGAPTEVKTLEGASEPFTTDEDNSDDFFSPVRGQTGRISILTESGLLESLIPEDDMSRPIKLIRVRDGKVMWQGYLGCDVYTQPYTERKNIITINVRSCLSASDSYPVEEDAKTIISIGDVLKNYMLGLESHGTAIAKYYIPLNAISVLDKYVNMSVFFDKKEIDNENSIEYQIVGKPYMDVLQYICTYMGWTSMEVGNTILFLSTDCKRYRCYELKYTYYQGVIHPVYVAAEDYVVREVELSEQEWIGADHTLDFVRGAKSVEVVASLGKYDMDMSLNETLPPFAAEHKGSFDIKDHMYMLPSENVDAHSNITYGYYRSDLRILAQPIATRNNAATTLAQVFDHMDLGHNPSIKAVVANPTSFTRFYSGAFMAKIAFYEDATQQYYETTDGLYCVLFPGMLSADGLTVVPPFDYDSVGPIFSMDSLTINSFAEGYLNLDADVVLLALKEGKTIHSDSIENKWKLTMEFRIGNKYYNGTGFQDSYCRFDAEFSKNNFIGNWNKDMKIAETSGILIPIDGTINGSATLKIWPTTSDLAYLSSTYACEMFFKRLDVKYFGAEDTKKVSRSANKYYQKIVGLKFSEEVSVNTNLASDMNNIPSPSILLNDENTPMTMLSYTDESGNVVMERPEKHLLKRLANYYGAIRRRVSVKIINRDKNVSPFDIVKGYYNDVYDSGVVRRYIPLSENREWRAGKRTIRCFEDPEG